MNVTQCEHLSKCTVYKKNGRKLIKTKNKLAKQKANIWLKNKIEYKIIKEELTSLKKKKNN